MDFLELGFLVHGDVLKHAAHDAFALLTLDRAPCMKVAHRSAVSGIDPTLVVELSGNGESQS